MKKLALLFLLFLASVGLGAQSFTVELSLEGEADGQPVQFATVSLIPKGAQKANKYILSDADGVARLEKVRRGEYTLKAELLGYKTLEKAVKVEGDTRLGKLLMAIDSQTLDAAKVTDVGNPITIKKDTIEYNATSFRTTDNDMLENLLKKLPGVEVASDGTVTANGQTITKITIDGKTFFLDDPQLATKNIPAKIIEKVKVVEKKSDQAIFTGIDDGEEETVIDLSLKKGMMNGWFGNVSAGGGYDLQPPYNSGWAGARWQGAAMVGNFTDKSQISIILNGNNTNNRGFNDMAGSMMRSMRGGNGGMGGGSGWGGSNGISTSWMAGANGVWNLLDNAMELGGNYLYNGNNTLITEKSEKTTYLDNGQTMLYKNGGPYDLLGRDIGDGGYGLNRTLTQGHRFGIRLEHKFSENTSLLFEPQVNFGGGRFNEYSLDSTWRSGAIKNAGFTSTDGNNDNWTASGRLLLRQRLGKPGRTFSANVRYNFSGNKIDGFNRSLTRSTDDGASWSGTPTDQWYEGNSSSSLVSTRLVYTEPLVENFYLEANAMYQWSRNTNNRNTYDVGHDASATTLAELIASETAARELNATYSKDITNAYHNFAAGMNLQYQLKKLRVQVGAAYRPTITDNLTNGKTYHSVVHNWAPQAMIRYEFSDNSDFRLFYRGQSSQPSTSQLMPVPDNSNPLSISFGNPYLKPYFTHRIRGGFGYTDKQTFFSIRGFFSANAVKDNITTARWYDDAGVQYAMPINGPLGGDANLGFFLNTPIAKSNFSLSNRFRASYSNNTNYVGISSRSDDFTDTYYDAATASFKYEEFNKDFFDTEKSKATKQLSDWFTTNRTQSLSVTENLKFTYRNDFVEASLSAGTTMNKGWYTIASSAANLRFRNQAQAEMLWTIPGGVGFNADASYIWYNGYTNTGNECIINAEITKLLFRNQFTLSLKVYDILNQSKNHYVTDSVNIHTETHNNTLGRYIILSLTYRFGNFGKAGRQMESRMQRDRAAGRGPRF